MLPRMRATAGGLTLILLLQPVAILACLYACADQDRNDVNSAYPQDTPLKAAQGRSHQHDGVPAHDEETPGFAQIPDSCVRSTLEPATLTSGTADTNSGLVPAALPQSASSVYVPIAGNGFVSAAVGSESPPGARSSRPLRI